MNTDDKHQTGLNFDRKELADLAQIRVESADFSNVIRFEDAVKFSQEVLRQKSINRIISLREM